MWFWKAYLLAFLICLAIVLVIKGFRAQGLKCIPLPLALFMSGDIYALVLGFVVLLFVLWYSCRIVRRR